jgi:hypothetical protein
MKKNIASIIVSGEVVITLNQGSTYTRPDRTRNALTDHKDMANKYKAKISFNLVRGLEDSTNAKITPYNIVAKIVMKTLTFKCI